MRSLTIGIAATALAAGAALAHHGWGSYDPARVVVLEGPVLESKFEFPHGEIVLEGHGKRWQVILAPPSRMENRGLPSSDLRKGSTVTVQGYPNREKPEEMRAERITAGGKTVELR